MKGGSALALGVAGLCLACPAEAQNRAMGALPSDSGHNPALTGIGRQLPRARQPLAGAGPQIRFSADSVIRENGTPGDRRSVVGSLPLIGSVSAEVGLFSVTGASHKEREAKRTDRITDVQPRRSRIAAVGLRMSF